MQLIKETKSSKLEVRSITKSIIKTNFIDLGVYCHTWIIDLNWFRFPYGKPKKTIRIKTYIHKPINSDKFIKGFDMGVTTFADSGRKTKFNTSVVSELIEPLINEVKQQINKSF